MERKKKPHDGLEFQITGSRLEILIPHSLSVSHISENTGGGYLDTRGGWVTMLHTGFKQGSKRDRTSLRRVRRVETEGRWSRSRHRQDTNIDTEKGKEKMV